MKWIKITDQMPKNGQKVIVQHETSNGKDHAFGVYHEVVEKWFYFNGSWKDEDSIEVTHWMPDLSIA